MSERESTRDAFPSVAPEREGGVDGLVGIWSPTLDAYPKAVKDYRQLGEYPEHGSNRRAWAWEFVRRNGHYQRLTDRLREPLLATMRTWRNHHLKGTPAFGLDPTLFSDEPVVREALFAAERELDDRFPSVVNPAHWNDDDGFEDMAFDARNGPWPLGPIDDPLRLDAQVKWIREIEESFGGVYSGRFVGYVLDLDARSLDRQIEQLRGLLQGAVKSREAYLKQERPSPGMVEESSEPIGERLPGEVGEGPRLLRILDGLAEGVSISELRKVLDVSPNRSGRWLADLRRRAERLRDGGFEQLFRGRDSH